MTDWLASNALQEPVDRHMRTDFVQLRAELTVAQALDTILQQQTAGRIIYFYVVDRDGRLQGVVPTRRLLLSPRDRQLSDIMIQPIVAIPRNATVLEACEFFILHKLLAFPVVDEQRRIVGMVDVELYTRELSDLDQRESQNDLFQLIGIRFSEAQQRVAPIRFRRRFPWLVPTLFGGLLAAWISDLYLDVASLAMVVPFIPLVLALAGSVTAQSVSLSLRALQGRPLGWGALLAKTRSELATSSLLGIVCGVIAGGLVLIWKGHPMTSLNLLVSIAGGVACAGTLGLLMPLMLRLFSRRPQVAAGPIALAVADAAALLVYFNLSRWLLT